MKDYIRLCPVCGTVAAPDAAQCRTCGTLLLGVDLSLKQEAPVASAIPEAALEGVQCLHEDCGAVNAPGSDTCLYCGRSMIAAGAVQSAPTLYSLPSALAAKFRIAEVLPAGGAEAEIMILAGLANADVKVVAKLYRPGIVPKTDVLERIGRAGFSHVVRLISHGESDGVHYEVMEYCPEGSLRRLMDTGPLRRDELRLMVEELAEALAALQDIDVIHRDLKPENILVRRREPLDLILTDFGIASLVDATQHFTGVARTVKYGAPETLSGVLDRAADWWSLGIILVELLTGRHPFAGLSDAVITHRLVTAGVDLSGVTDPDWRKLCGGLLLRDPQKRWGAAEVRRWLTGDPSLVLPRDEAPAGAAHAGLPYRLDEAICHTPAELAAALATHWDAGRKDLMRGQITAWAGQELKDQNLVRFLQDLLDVRDITDDLRLLRLIVRLAPAMPPVWRGSGLAVAKLLAQAAIAAQGDATGAAKAADWLASVFVQKALRELPPAQHPAEAALAARWETAGARLLALWRDTEQARLRWTQEHTRRGGYANFDALVYGHAGDNPLPPPAKLQPVLLLAIADESYAAQLRARLWTEARPHLEHAPWLEALLREDEPVGWVVAHLLLPHAAQASAEAEKRRQREIEAEAARFTELAARTNETLARLRDACEYLGVFASETERANTSAACTDLLALVADARAAGVPAEAPLMRTLRRAEPVVLRIQDRLDAWAHAARVNALFRNRNLAQGAGGFFSLLFMFAAQVLSRFLIWLIIIPAAIFGWRMWGIVELRNAIRDLGRALPARIPIS
ncbi:MAG: inactive serine/threonine-protein kinase VRK3 [Pseudomonadota bacterium]